MKLVKECGYQAFEFWSWWDKDIDSIVAAKEDLGLEVATFCTKFANPGDKTLQKDFITGWKETVDTAKKLDTKAIIMQAGYQSEVISYKEHRNSLIETVKEASKIAEQEDVTLLIEPLNTLVDHKGYHMWSSLDAFEFCDQINNPKVKVLFDIYHQQIMEGNLISNITANIDKIGHFHAAGCPGRAELMTGEINYRNVILAIELTGYEGYLGLEYMTKEDPKKSLLETKSYLQHNDRLGLDLL
jgi:hydroxypyruvate isomerase